MILHDYQEIAVDHLLRNPRAALFLDMGLGKTAVTLRALTPRHLPALVTAPKRVTEEVWAEEAGKWRPDLSIAIAAGDPRQRLAALKSEADITVISRDNLRDALQVGARFNTFVIDELSGFKTRNSVRWKTARKFTAPVHVWGLTGTPSPNGLMDLWAQVYLLDTGQRLGRTLTEYQNRFFTPGRQLANGVITEWIIRPFAEEKIHALLADICLSMETEGRLELPPVTYNPVSVPLAPEIRKVYKGFQETLVADLEVIGGEIHTAGNAAILSSKLSQVAAGFIYVDNADLREGAYDILHQEKVKAVQEIVEGTGSPVLVFYRYKAERDMIGAAMPGLVHTVEEPGVIAKWNAGKIPVLLTHPQSVGHGLNLQDGGHTIIWSSLSWSLEDWQQGNKRLDRQGQKHPVVIHMLISPNTVDTAIQDRLQNKASVQQALRNYLDSLL